MERKVVYLKSLNEFNDDVLNNKIVDKILEGFKLLGKSKDKNYSEIASWQNSLQYIKNLFQKAALPSTIWVGIEYQIPLNNKGRIDVIVYGKDKNDMSNVGIIELKQWSTMEKTELLNYVKTFLGGRKRVVIHPSIQALSYKYSIKDFYESVREKNYQVHSCAYLHNMQKIDQSLFLSELDVQKESPTFFKDDIDLLESWLKEKFLKGNGKEIAYDVVNSNLSPSKSVQMMYCEILKNKENYHLLIDQLEIYLKVISSFKDNKITFIEGKAGSGKTILAAQLLNHCFKEGLNAAIVTTNKYLRDSIILALGNNDNKKIARLNNVITSAFALYNVFWEYDVLIVDEAQAIKPWQQKGISSIDLTRHMLKVAKNVIFLYDDRQIVQANEIGSEEIRRIAKETILSSNKFNSKIEQHYLLSQVRSRASNALLELIEYLFLDFELKPKLPKSFKFKFHEDPNLLWESVIGKNNEGKVARVLATFSWKWISQNDAFDSLQNDIVIEKYHFEKPWNANELPNWIQDSRSASQIGCIHSSRGQEVDYVGVIIGSHIIYRENKIQIDWKRWFGNAKRGLKSKPEEQWRIAYNEIYTLMTRARFGCEIFIEDDALREHIKTKLKDF